MSELDRTNPAAAHEDAFYFRWHESYWFGGSKGDEQIEARTVKIVQIRKRQKCMGCRQFKGQWHPSGTYMMRDHAIVDGKWGTCYTCLPCIEKWGHERT